MKEDFLHYIWQNKKFDFSNLKTTQGESLTLVNVGSCLQQEGPDFFNAQLIIGNQKWAGNVEIHLKSSDWYLHNHEKDVNYDSVILHVVWEHDTDIYRKNNSTIPVLELKKLVSQEEISKYNTLLTPKSWIFCEKDIASISEVVFTSWQERLFFERLENKSIPFEMLLKQNHSDWEATLFCMLAKNFGLNINGQSFLDIAKSISFSIIKKESFEVENLEALFFGIGQMLNDDKQDTYLIDLQQRWQFLKHKHQIEVSHITPVQFFKLRPDNFPTIRLAQLAMLYHSKQTLFVELILAKTKEEIYAIFNNATSDYWINHYNFDSQSINKVKKISHSFIDLIIINTLIPLKFLYARANGKDTIEELIDLIQMVKSEKNSTVEKFAFFKIKSKNAFESQALLQLKNEYCNNKKCLQCEIGLTLLKK
ncbi:DUF2851 family protein [uncultured Flavobacterium sp.]|uniref:DUF2851 family protein n=1 Tax=uncultured Flavobacterium sp. TaxID=165435 RepID=UPI0030EC2953|tara:strand:- start:1108 stop:2376 length:1269 start_codon:yes stop_codon:yes gene_type:complete